MRKHPLIFVVDDDHMILKLIETQLKSVKMEVMSFSYGEECLPKLHLLPDVIILDYIFVKGNNPVLSGLEILQEIRIFNPEVPVIMLSGQNSGNVVLELIKPGIDEYIIKEKNFITQLKEVVVHILENK